MAFIVLAGASVSMPKANASPGIVYSDPEDGYVGTGSDNHQYPAGESAHAGDGPVAASITYRVFVKFDVSGLSGTLSSATLHIYVHESRIGANTYSSGQLPNPGLGDCVVRHIDDYGTLDTLDYNRASILNDPGVLIGATETPNVGYLSIDVTAAMQDDINHGRPFTSFMIKMSTDNDIDNSYDYFSFYMSERAGAGPYIEYAFARPVGGYFTPVNKLAILTPYLALLGLVGAVTVAVATTRRRKV